MLNAADWSACDLSGSNRHYRAGVDERRSAMRMCCLVDGKEALLQESQMHLLKAEGVKVTKTKCSE